MNQAADECDLLLDYMFGELNDADMKQFEDYLLTSRACSSEFDALWFVHQRLLTALPSHLDESIISRKDLVLEHAYALRLPVSPARGDSPGNPQPPSNPQRVSATRDRLLVELSSNNQPSKPIKWNKTFVFRASLVVSLIVFLLAGGVFGTHMERFTHPSATVQSAATTVNLKASASYPKSVGEVRIAQGQHPSLTVNIHHVPVQQKSACYDVWAISGNRVFSLGEFLVNQNGSGGMTIDLKPGTEFNRIKITLEPRWGDPSPLGPAVLTGSSIIKPG